MKTEKQKLKYLSFFTFESARFLIADKLKIWIGNRKEAYTIAFHRHGSKYGIYAKDCYFNVKSESLSTGNAS